MSLLKRLAPLALLGGLAFGSPQPAQALDVYLGAQIGAISPSDSNIQKMYGTMPKFGVGLGVESNGWGAEVNFGGAIGNKSTTVSGLTAESDLVNLELALRAQKAFGTRGNLRFFVGLEGCYLSMNESVHVKYYGFDVASASISASGVGGGVFAGIDFSIFKNFLLSLEGKYTFGTADGKVDSSSGGVTAIPRKGVGLGGISGVLGMKYYF